MHADGHAVLTPSPQCTVRLTGCCVFCGSDTLMMSHIHHQGITHGVLIALNTLCPFTARVMSLHPECGFPTCPASAGHGMETPPPPAMGTRAPGRPPALWPDPCVQENSTSSARTADHRSITHGRMSRVLPCLGTYRRGCCGPPCKPTDLRGRQRAAPLGDRRSYGHSAVSPHHPHRQRGLDRGTALKRGCQSSLDPLGPTSL